MRFLRILSLTQYALIFLTILCHIPFTIITFVDKTYYFSSELNATISQIQEQARRTYIKSFTNTTFDNCDELKQYNSSYYCISRFKTNQSAIVRYSQNCPSALNFTQNNFNTNSHKYCFNIPYNVSTCPPTNPSNCYRSDLNSFPLQDITPNNTIILNQFIGSVNTNNVDCTFLQNFFQNLISRTQRSYRILNTILLVFWFINLIPMFFQVIATGFYIWGKNQVQNITLWIIKVTTMVILVIQVAMGLTLIIVSFDIVNQSRSIMDYNECFLGEYKMRLENFPYLEGRLMGNFKVFVIFITVFTLLLAVGLVFMETFRRAYHESEKSGIRSKGSQKMSQGEYTEMDSYIRSQ